ncbi:hypothetical protein DAPPUDRAFT_258327 [Daphnia pulex]|uniref:Uncharacterized protein n=1 Tax=Daphnia pulex TaxID=6669 RepID=E9HF75_DAPPU|nr:hypothetical protein DAPPUDRAFT_258327 [Daphnia pulex]|eukprot:EFX69608.1 hypothetical protein DAPPUDRAFT_258327 [Daphnia pulex]
MLIQAAKTRYSKKQMQRCQSEFLFTLNTDCSRKAFCEKVTAGGYAALPCDFTAGGRVGFLYPTNLPPEAKREYPMSGNAWTSLPYKFTAGGQWNLAKVTQSQQLTV